MGLLNAMTPPPGYHIATKEELNCLPDTPKRLSPTTGEWVGSAYEKEESVHEPARERYLYALPNAPQGRASTNPQLMKNYKTRDGREARVFMIADAGTQPVLGAVAGTSGKWHATEWSMDGSYLLGGAEHDLDLIGFPGEAWKLPDPPPGQEWHRDDWTEEMLPDGYRPLLLGELPEEGDEVIHSDGLARKQTPSQLQYPAASEAARQRTRRPLPDPYAELKAAHAAGKVIQFRHSIGGAWTDGRSFEWVLPPDFYRVKPDPLGPEDVPPGSVILWNATPGNFASTPHEWSSVLGVIPGGVYTVGFYVGSPDEPTIDFTSFKDLVPHQIKRPNEDWKPCHK